MQNIGQVANLVLPSQDPLFIDCAGTGQDGGENNTPHSLTLYCEPTNRLGVINNCLGTIAHELSHNWIATSNQDASFENQAFNNIIGCRQDESGTYIYENETPSKIIYNNQSCLESWGTANDAYVTQACDMKINFPKQYNFIKNNIYGGKEFCNS